MSQSNDIIQVQGINSQGYGIIPKMVMQDKRLTIQAKAIYGYFCSYAGSGKTAFPKRSKILSDLKISKDSYYKHFNLLKDYGYIEVTQEKDKDGYFDRNIYTLIESVPCPKNQDSAPCPNLPCPVLPYTDKQDIIKVTDSKINSIYNYQSVSQTDGQPYAELLSLIRRNVSYNDLQVTHEEDMPLINEFISVILDALVSGGKTVRIGGEDKPRELVRSNLIKLTYEDIVYVIERYKGVKEPIRRKRQYMLSMLYHTSMELEAYYTNRVQADKEV